MRSFPHLISFSVFKLLLFALVPVGYWAKIATDSAIYFGCFFAFCHDQSPIKIKHLLNCLFTFDPSGVFMSSPPVVFVI